LFKESELPVAMTLKNLAICDRIIDAREALTAVFGPCIFGVDAVSQKGWSVPQNSAIYRR
jgi:hypothetical protein